MKITLAFYKAEGTIVDKLIRLITKSEYSHVEMIIKDNWVSSSASAGGVVLNSLHSLNKEAWDYVEVEVDGRKLKKVLKFIEVHKNAKYDNLGVIFGGLFSSKIENKDKFFCSEMMVIILKIFGHNKVNGLIPSFIDPGELYNIIKE